MASKALVAMTPPLQYMNILINLTAQLPSPLDRCCHNRLHGELLQIKAVLDRALCTDRWDLKELLYSFIRHFQALKSWCVSYVQRPFSWPVWGAEQGGCFIVACDWSSALPPGESSLSGSGRVAERILLWDLPVQALWHTHVWAPYTSTGASGAWHTFLTLLYGKSTLLFFGRGWGRWHATKVSNQEWCTYTVCVLKALKVFFFPPISF